MKTTRKHELAGTAVGIGGGPWWVQWSGAVWGSRCSVERWLERGGGPREDPQRVHEHRDAAEGVHENLHVGF